MSAWFKKIALSLILLGILDITVPLAWAALRPAAPILLATGVAIFLLLRLFKNSGGW